MFCTKQKVQKRLKLEGWLKRDESKSSITTRDRSIRDRRIIFEGARAMADGNIGKSAAKVFLDVLTHPLTLNFGHFFPSAKHPKITFAACFLVVNLYFES